jgi:F-type H+-transporting ATPase subunit delta
LQWPPIIASRAATLQVTFIVAGGSAGSILTFGEITRVENSGGIQASLSGRYATALFELARDGKAIDSVGESLESIKSALAQSGDFSQLTTNPLLSRAASAKAVAAVAKSLKVDALTTKFLGVLAQNRRLGELNAIIAAYAALASAFRGEATAEVTSAHALDKAQVAALKAKLKAKVGRDVAVAQKVDPAILGGLVVRIGSQMIDSSIRTRLNTLANAMKG